MEQELKKLSIQVDLLINHKDFNTKDFLKFTKLISKSENIKILQSFFLLLQKYYEENERKKKKNKYPKVDITLVNIKKFFSFYTILFYPKIMNTDTKSITFKNLKSKGYTMKIYFLMIVNLIKNEEVWDDKTKMKLLLRVGGFMNNYSEYILRFNDWKDMDKEYLIYNLTKTYYNLETDFREIEIKEGNKNSKELYELTKKNVESEKNKTMRKIILLDKKNGEEKFKSYYELLLKREEYKEKQEEFIDKLVLSFQKNMKKSFWDIMKQDLEKTPPETLNFINNLKELINTIISCVPNKVEYREEINRVIDVELIDQMIKHNVYRYEDLVKVVEYVNGLLWKFQSPSEDSKTELYEKEIKNMIQKDDNIIEVLIFFLSNVMEKFENILLLRYKFFENKKKIN
jgi:hypothetical protein